MSQSWPSVPGCVSGALAAIQGLSSPSRPGADCASLLLDELQCAYLDRVPTSCLRVLRCSQLLNHQFTGCFLMQVPDTPDTYVTNAGFVFVSSEGLDEAPAATDYSNMTNREVAHAIFGAPFFNAACWCLAKQSNQRCL